MTESSPNIIFKLKRLFLRIRESNIETRAASLAFHTLLAIVPIAGLIFWYLKSIGVSTSWIHLIHDFLLAQLNLESANRVISLFDRLTTPKGGQSWGWIGLAFIFYTTFNLIRLFGQSLDHILHTHPERTEFARHGFFYLFFRRLGVMLLLPVALMLSLVATQWIKEDSWFRFLLNLETVGPFITLPLAWIVDIVVFFLIYYLIPRSHVPAGQALKAALVVGPLSEIVKNMFGTMSQSLVGLHRIYGVFVVIPLFILWVQIAWMVILSGAFLMKVARQKRTPESPS